MKATPRFQLVPALHPGRSLLLIQRRSYVHIQQHRAVTGADDRWNSVQRSRRNGHYRDSPVPVSHLHYKHYDLPIGICRIIRITQKKMQHKERASMVHIKELEKAKSSLKMLLFFEYTSLMASVYFTTTPHNRQHFCSVKCFYQGVLLKILRLRLFYPLKVHGMQCKSWDGNL